MYQQINLFQPIFRKQRKIFTALTVVRLLGLSLLVMLAYYAALYWRLNGLHESLAQVRSQHEFLDAQLRTIEASADPAQVSALEQEIANLHQILASRQEVAEKVNVLLNSHLGGFSKIFEALARQRIAGLWLTGISISEGGTVMELRGSSQIADLVPTFLEFLAEEPSLDAFAFSQVEIERDLENALQVNFTLDSHDDEDSGS